MFFTYILASDRNGTLYTGMTDDLVRRVWEHKEKIRLCFTSQYNVTRLVWYEMHHSRDSAFRRERRIKEWKRVWKLELVERTNPEWHDLHESLERSGPDERRLAAPLV